MLGTNINEEPISAKLRTPSLLAAADQEGVQHTWTNHDPFQFECLEETCFSTQLCRSKTTSGVHSDIRLANSI